MAIRSVSEHVKQRMTERSVPVDSIQDAIENPPEIGPVKYDKAGRPPFYRCGAQRNASCQPGHGCDSDLLSDPFQDTRETFGGVEGKREL